MSSEIVYDKQFVKVDNNTIVPMLLSGSSNCFTQDRAGRYTKGSRDWFPWAPKGISYHTSPSNLLKIITDDIEKVIKRNLEKDPYYPNDKIPTREEIQNSFGWYTGIAIGGRSTTKTTSIMYYNLYKNGIKNAKTIEELASLGIYLQFHIYEMYDKNLGFDIPNWNYRNIKSAEEYHEVYNKVIELKRDFPEISIYLSFNLSEDGVTGRIKRSRTKNRGNYDVKEQSFFYTLKNIKGYLHRYLKYGYKYSWYSVGKQFKDEASAKAYKDSLIKAKKLDADTWNIERKEGRMYIKVPTA